LNLKFLVFFFKFFLQLFLIFLINFFCKLQG
jgi:hypothetical protein